MATRKGATVAVQRWGESPVTVFGPLVPVDPQGQVSRRAGTTTTRPATREEAEAAAQPYRQAGGYAIVIGEEGV